MASCFETSNDNDMQPLQGPPSIRLLRSLLRTGFDTPASRALRANGYWGGAKNYCNGNGNVNGNAMRLLQRPLGYARWRTHSR